MTAPADEFAERFRREHRQVRTPDARERLFDARLDLLEWADRVRERPTLEPVR